MSDPHPRTGAVFLSYASEDADAAARICESLRAAGIEVWFDRDELRGGDAWDSKIKKQIHDCALFVPLISAHSNVRSEGYFRREWKQAVRRMQDLADDVAFLLPVVIDDTREASARVPEEFLGAQWTRLPGGDVPTAFTQHVYRLLGRKSEGVSTAGGAASGPNERSEHRPDKGFQSHVPSRNRVAGALAALLLLGLGAGAWWFYQRAEVEPTESQTAAKAQLVSMTAANEKSIAVLPFVDLSPKKDQEYMSDGIAEELLNRLAKASDLKVIARTSSFAFKGRNIEIADIAHRLNVAHVLEGSVRKSGNKVRITAQLIRASDSSHLWSETYDRELDDNFAVQDEIATAIMRALQVRLSAGTLGRQEGGTASREAFELYLRGWSGEDWNSRESLDAAEQYFKKATQIDPEYGLAWSALANITIVRAELGQLNAKEAYSRARQLTQRALEVAPETARAHADLQDILFIHDWNFMAAEAEAERAIALDPSDPNVLNSAGRLSIALGRLDVARRQFRAALDRDPLNEYFVYNLGIAYYLDRQFAEAESISRRLLDMSPKFQWTRVLLSQTLLLQGKPDEALAIIQEDRDESMRLVALPIVLWGAGRREQADRALRDQVAYWGDKSASFIAVSYAYRGDHERALEWLEQAYEQRDPSLYEVIGDPLLGKMLEDPRYKAFRRKIDLPDLPEAA